MNKDVNLPFIIDYCLERRDKMGKEEQDRIKETLEKMEKDYYEKYSKKEKLI